MSGILARLRHAFQDELLVRVGRNLEPTALAAELAAPVRETVRQVEDLLNLRQPFAPETSRWSFRIAASDYVTFLLLGQLLKLLAERAPNISVRFFALEPTAGDRLAAGDIDFAILPAEFEPKSPSYPCSKTRGSVPCGRVIRTRASGLRSRVPRVPASELPLGGPRSRLHCRELPCRDRLRTQDRRIHRELRDGSVPAP